MLFDGMASCCAWMKSKEEGEVEEEEEDCLRSPSDEMNIARLCFQRASAMRN